MITLPRVASPRRARGWVQRAELLVRHTGATLPYGDPVPTHWARMEGWFWRCTDRASGRVLVVLCGVNRHPDGDWATVAVAAHPGGIVRSAVLDDAVASETEMSVTAGSGAFCASRERVEVDLGADCSVRFDVTRPVLWPMRLGGGGVFSAVPWLGQYWHPHVLGGQVSGSARIDGQQFDFEGADVYAEKNWGDGFPERWWWGQAQGFADDACVAFGGGLLRAGPVAVHVGGLVVRIGANVLRFTPPWSRVRATADGSRWEVHARRPGQWAHVVGTGVGEPHVLPVPVPAERRNVFSDFEHLAGRMEVRLGGRAEWSGESVLAGLEIGHRPV